MAESTVYRDSNGVDWAFVPAAKLWLAYMAQGERRYEPEPPDQVAATVAELRARVEAYARAHRSEVTLVVRAKADNSAWMLLLLLALALSDGR
jgi:hypothetical protein